MTKYQITSIVMKLFVEAASRSQIFFGPDDTLSHIGIDSLDLLEISCGIEAKLGLDIPDAILSQINTPRELIEYVVAKLPAEPQD